MDSDNTEETEQLCWRAQVTACLAAAVVHLAQLPPKLNQVIQPLMASLRKEPHPPFQRVAAEALAQLMLLCIARQPCPNDRVIRNACVLACQEMPPLPAPEDSPPLGSEATALVQSPAATASLWSDKLGQIQLSAQSLALGPILFRSILE